MVVAACSNLNWIVFVTHAVMFLPWCRQCRHCSVCVCLHSNDVWNVSNIQMFDGETAANRHRRFDCLLSVSQTLRCSNDSRDRIFDMLSRKKPEERSFVIKITSSSALSVYSVAGKSSRLYTISHQQCPVALLWETWGSGLTGVISAWLVKQEAQLMLTTGSTRLAVSRGQQTWYHSTCYI